MFLRPDSGDAPMTEAAPSKTGKSKTNGDGCSGAVKHSAVVASDKLSRIKVRGADDATIKWDAAFATYGGHGADQSSTIVYEILPGGHLGWHTALPKRRSTSSQAQASCARKRAISR